MSTTKSEESSGSPVTVRAGEHHGASVTQSHRLWPKAGTGSSVSQLCRGEGLWDQGLTLHLAGCVIMSKAAGAWGVS